MALSAAASAGATGVDCPMPLARLPPVAPEKPKVAIELITAAEATWHIVVLVLFVAMYIFGAFWMRHSALLGLFVVLGLAVATVGATSALPFVTNAVRAEALSGLRAAVAAGDVDRIKQAIRFAQAVGVSEEEAASAEELRAAVFGKLRTAVQEGNARRVSAAVRCVRAADMCREELAAAFGFRAGPPHHAMAPVPAPVPCKIADTEAFAAAPVPAAPTKAPTVVAPLPSSSSTRGPALVAPKALRPPPRPATPAPTFAPPHAALQPAVLALRPTPAFTTTSTAAAVAAELPGAAGNVEAVGLTAEEVALAEHVLVGCGGTQQAPPGRDGVAMAFRPGRSVQGIGTKAPWGAPRAHDARGDAFADGGDTATAVVAGALSAHQALRELHLAIEACEVEWMREAIAAAEVLAVDPDELAFARAMLQIEEGRERQAAMQALRRASMGEDPARLWWAIGRGRSAGVGAEALHTAQASLQAILARQRCRMPRGALAGGARAASATEPERAGRRGLRVTFAADVVLEDGRGGRGTPLFAARAPLAMAPMPALAAMGGGQGLRPL
mmetsp:Transcript_7478/g.21283  ORF Transcript_7478/g.21283 Transcript_7478/m.21283 type:complete len:558 (-) Transcript_7478:95-1768(-)